MPYSVDDFAAQVKAKYPQYASWPNDHLVAEIVAKHPEYQGWVTLDPDTSARISLASRGLTPEMVKNGQGVTTPDQIQFAPPKQVNGGFVGGLLSNPVAGLGQQVDQLLGRRQYASDQEHQAPPALPEQTVAQMMVPDFKGTYDEATRRGAANISTSDMYGKATQAAAVAGVGMAAGPMAERMGASAIKQYRSVVDPSGSNPLAGEVAADMLGKGQIMRDPRTAIASYGENRANAANARLDNAIDNMPGPIDAGRVAAKINATKAKLYNPDPNTNAAMVGDGPAPIDANANQIAAKLDAYSANHILGNSQAFLDPDGNLVFQMDPKVARILKQRFDPKFYEKGSEANDAIAQKGVGDALRDTLNQDPNVAAENAAVNKALTIKDEIAPNAAKDTIPPMGTAMKSIAHGAIAEGAGAFMPVARPFLKASAAIYGGVPIAKLVIDVMRSPAWKTTSAVAKARLAAAVAAGDTDVVSRIASGIATGNASDNQ